MFTITMEGEARDLFLAMLDQLGREYIIDVHVATGTGADVTEGMYRGVHGDELALALTFGGELIGGDNGGLRSFPVSTIDRIHVY